MKFFKNLISFRTVWKIDFSCNFWSVSYYWASILSIRTIFIFITRTFYVQSINLY